MKVSVIGAGNVGSTVAYILALRGIDVVLVDIIEGLAAGKALDIMQCSSLDGFSSSVAGSEDYALTADSDVVVITAGVARKPGMKREDTIETNTKVVKSVVSKVKEFSPDSILVVVTNPLDAMVHVAHKASGFDSKKVIGMAAVLDSARYKTFISSACGCKASDVDGVVLGSHGELMVPLSRLTTVNGSPLSSLLSRDKIDGIVDRTQKGGAEIVSLMNTSAYYAPARSVVEMVSSILLDEKKVLPCSVYCNGEYGFNDVFVGLPAVLGKNGVEKIVVLDLNSGEKEKLSHTVAFIKEMTSIAYKYF